MRQALKLALEALTHIRPSALTSFYTIGDRDKAIIAIKEALAQPEQKSQLLFEIDGEMLTASQMMGVELFNFQQATGCDTAAEFLAQPEQEPVLVECGNCHEGLADMEHVCKKCLGAGWVNNPQLKEPEQEPVALKRGECWPEDVMQMWDYYRKEIANGNTGSEPRDWFESLAEMRLVDTTPPQRKPLTLHELSKIFASIPSIPFDGEWQLELARAIEAAHGIKE